MYDVVQEIGRANRSQNLDGCSYCVYLSFLCLMSTFVRIMTSSNAQERQRLQMDLHDVISFLLLPQMCYHSFIESYFEWNEITKNPCLDQCSYCTGATAQFTGVMKRAAIENVLCQSVLQNRNATPDSVKKDLTKHKADIFEVVPKSSGPIHALLLQLYASKMIRFEVRDNNVIGTDKLTTKHLYVDVVYAVVDNVEKPAYYVDAAWERLNVK
jgi:superfamily II DNA helicase RecQ